MQYCMCKSTQKIIHLYKTTCWNWWPVQVHNLYLLHIYTYKPYMPSNTSSLRKTVHIISIIILRYLSKSNTVKSACSNVVGRPEKGFFLKIPTSNFATFFFFKYYIKAYTTEKDCAVWKSQQASLLTAFL